MKNFKQMILAGAVATLMGSSVMAAEVGDITTFTAGTPAQASQVNANFQALITAINDNNSRIEALEAAQGINSSVGGRHYKLRDMGWILAAHRNSQVVQSMPDGSLSVNGGFARIGFYVGNIDLSFVAGQGTPNAGTFTINGSDVEVEMFVNASSDIGTNSSELSESGTWVQNGNVLEMTFPGDEGEDPHTLEFTASKGGLVLTANNGGLMEITYAYDSFYQHEYEASLIIAVEVDAPAP